MATYPFLIHVRQRGFEGYLFVYSDCYENACVKVQTLYPDADCTNCTIP